MRDSRRLGPIGTLIVAMLAVTAVPVAAAGTTVRYVDGDGHASPGDCDGSGHAFKHIQPAVDASDDDDTVIVCPGTYEETVLIQGNRDGLTLKSSTPFGATIKTPASLTSPIGVPGFTTLVFVKRVDSVTIRGFKLIARTQAPCDNLWVGILAVASKGTQMRGNRLLAPGSGPSADCYTAFGMGIVDTVIQSNGHFLTPRATSATIGFNEIRDVIAVGIEVEGEFKTSSAYTVHNSVRAYFGQAPAGTIISGGVSTGQIGIGYAGKATGVIRDNVVQGSADGPVSGPTFQYGIAIRPLTALHQNGPIDIHDNIVRRVVEGFLGQGARDLHGPAQPTDQHPGWHRHLPADRQLHQEQLRGSRGYRHPRRRRVDQQCLHAQRPDRLWRRLHRRVLRWRDRGYRQQLGGQQRHGRWQPTGHLPGRTLATSAPCKVPAAGPGGVRWHRSHPQGVIHAHPEPVDRAHPRPGGRPCGHSGARRRAGGTTRFVDGDGHASTGDCDGSGHAYKHIQKAVLASGPGDTVIVCPGTYEEQVVITGDRDGLTLKSSTPFAAIIKSPVSLKGSYGQPSFNVLLLVQKVDDVTIRGFKTIARTSAPCEITYVTMLAVASRRTAFRGNRLLAPGASASAACGQFFGIGVVSSIDGPGGVIARSSSATIGFNEVRDTYVVGIESEAFGRKTSVDVVHNSVRAYFGHNPAGGSISGTVPTAFAGISSLGRVSGSFTDNVIQGSTSGPISGPHYLVGFSFSSAPTLLNGPVVIQDNIIRRVQEGMTFSGTSGLSVTRNQVSNTIVGIELVSVLESVLHRNTVGARALGIHVSGASSDNTVSGNTVSGAGGSCVDETTGGGSAGTANTWSGNTATVVGTPPAICPVAP